MRRLLASVIALAGLLILEGCSCGGSGGNGDCAPTTCEAVGANCGTVDDGCGGSLQCGYCGGGLTCGGDGVPNVCGGTVSCSPATCADVGAACGELPDGCGATLNCGYCSAGLACGGAGAANACGVGGGCPPRTCASAGAECGVILDGCGGSRSCGGAEACGDETCGGGGAANTCGTDACTAKTECEVTDCGVASDGCAGVLDCGGCDGLQLCNPSGRCTDTATSVGEPCESDEGCATGRCLGETASGWPGGYCTTGCDADDDCGRGNHCGSLSAGVGVCVDTCTLNTECPRAGYACRDTDGDGRSECAPSGTGTGGVGDPCDTIADCSGGGSAVCITDAQGADDGYCTVTCGSGATAAPCPAGSHCSFEDGGAVCTTDCQSATDCRAGYSCRDWDGDGTAECGPAGDIGDECEEAADCASGTCYSQGSSGYPGGYCSTGCTSNADCPGGSSCVGSLGLCMSDCTSTLDCRGEGYACAETGSGGSACVPYGGGGGDVGDTCNSVADCGGGQGAMCVGDDSGYTGGYCTQSCTTSAECPDGSSCATGPTGGNICQTSCVDAADCRTGYECTTDPQVGGIQTCSPSMGSGGDNATGQACEVDDDCALLVCLHHEDTSWRGGYCTGPCVDDSMCGDGSHCGLHIQVEGGSAGLCYQSCSGDGDCRTGLKCFDMDGDGRSECAGYGSGGGGVGDPCEAIDECGGRENADCNLDPMFPAGYCTVDCEENPGICGADAHCTTYLDARFCADSVCCAEDLLCDLDETVDDLYPDCPVGTRCQQVDVIDSVGRCVLESDTCTRTLACPDGSYCSNDDGGYCIFCNSQDRCRDNYECHDRDRRAPRECWPAAKGTGGPGSPCDELRDCSGGVYGTCLAQTRDGYFQGGYCIWDCTDGIACPGGSACINLDYTDVAGVNIRFRLCLDTCSSDTECRAGYTCASLVEGQPRVCYVHAGD